MPPLCFRHAMQAAGKCDSGQMERNFSIGLLEMIVGLTWEWDPQIARARSSMTHEDEQLCSIMLTMLGLVGI